MLSVRVASSDRQRLLPALAGLAVPSLAILTCGHCCQQPEQLCLKLALPAALSSAPLSASLARGTETCVLRRSRRQPEWLKTALAPQQLAPCRRVRQTADCATRYVAIRLSGRAARVHAGVKPAERAAVVVDARASAAAAYVGRSCRPRDILRDVARYLATVRYHRWVCM
jgi:hypothetical protein